jgi:ubiquitin carboxyl-terminal hydrolase 4/11/15
MLQNMFDIGYFSGLAGSFPTGWSEVDEDKTYPSITSRIPHLQQDEDAESGNEFEGNSTRTGSESSIEDEEQSENTASSMTRMTEESSDEDASLPQQRVSGIFFIVPYPFVPTGCLPWVLLFRL